LQTRLKERKGEWRNSVKESYSPDIIAVGGSILSGVHPFAFFDIGFNDSIQKA
jgi:hypothetical protein